MEDGRPRPSARVLQLWSPPPLVVPYRLPFTSKVKPSESPPGTVARILNLGCAQAVDINAMASATIVRDRRKAEGPGRRPKPSADRHYIAISRQKPWVPRSLRFLQGAGELTATSPVFVVDSALHQIILDSKYYLNDNIRSLTV